MQSSAVFETANAHRYLISLCEHFSRRIEATHKAGKGRVQFPFGLCEMTADNDELAFFATAEDQGQLDLIAQTVTSHLERFAFREDPHLTWKPEPK